VSRLRPVGASAAVVQGSDINKGTYIQIYQSTLSLILIDFTFLEGRDNEFFSDYHSNRSSLYVFKIPYGLEEVPMLNARINNAISHYCNWNDSDVLYSELTTVLHREVSSTVAIYCFGHKKQRLLAVLSIGQLLVLISLVALN
jgi:hypothetical protein